MQYERPRWRTPVMTLIFAIALGLSLPQCPADTPANPPATTRGNVMETMKARLIQLWCEKPDPAAAGKYLQTLQADGTWGDIDYASREVTGWSPGGHPARTSAMAIAARAPGTSAEDAERLFAGVGKALDAWISRDPQSKNWWWNEINVPRETGRILLLLGDRATPGQKESAKKIFDRAKIRMTGQNLVWLANNNVLRGLVENDEKRVAESFSRIWEEVRDDLKEGVMPDASFHQHGTQFYVGGYGSSFLADTANLMAVSAGTPMAAPREKIRIVERYLLDGVQWMVYGGMIDPASRGRGIARKESNPESMVRIAAANLLAAIPPEQTHPGLPTRSTRLPRWLELQAVVDRLHANPLSRKGALSGNRYYWHSDFMVSHHTNSWYASVKTTSSRILGTEFGNGENRNAHGLLFGQQYIMRRGDEYKDIYPVWDWSRVPGATMEAITEFPVHDWSKGTEGSTSFVGGASDGSAGVAAFDLLRDGVKARKFWLFADNAVIALGAGLESTGKLPLRTSINQCWLKGNVIAHTQRGLVTLSDNTTESGRIDYLLHDQIGYAILGNSTITVTNKTQKGRWADINRAGSKDLIERPVFSVWIDHAAEKTYAYALFPNSRPDIIGEQVASLHVLANTADVQCVGLGNLTAAVFYKAGALGKGEDSLSVDKPCIVLIRATPKGRQIAVANPENKPLQVKVQVGPKTFTVDLPAGPMAGSTVVLAP